MCDWCAFGWAFLFSCGLIFSFVPSPLNPSASIGSSIPLYRTMFSSTPAQLVWSFSNTTDQTHIRSFDDSEYFIRSWAWCMSLFQSIMNISNRKRNQMRIFLSLSLFLNIHLHVSSIWYSPLAFPASNALASLLFFSNDHLIDFSFSFRHAYPETAYITATPTGTIGPITVSRHFSCSINRCLV